MNPKGFYPNKSFLSKNASFISNRRQGIVFSVVRSQKADNQFFNSETSWALVSEIRLWASIILAIPKKDAGIYIFYPNNYPISLDDTDFAHMNFNSDAFLTAINNYVNKKTGGLNLYTIDDYKFNDYDFDTSIHKQIFHNIRCNNNVLIRGLSNLIKARMLIKSNAYHFMEEAILLVYLAIESAISLIRNQMQKEGILNPKIKDIFNRISTKYTSGEDVTDFFEECNMNRIILVHSENKYINISIPDLAADDFFDTCKTIEEFYRDLLLMGF